MSDSERDGLIISIKTSLEDFKYQLLGNGQPGIIQDLQKKTSTLEEYKNRANGAFAVIIGLLTLIGGGELVKFFTQ